MTNPSNVAREPFRHALTLYSVPDLVQLSGASACIVKGMLQTGLKQYVLPAEWCAQNRIEVGGVLEFDVHGAPVAYTPPPALRLCPAPEDIAEFKRAWSERAKEMGIPTMVLEPAPTLTPAVVAVDPVVEANRQLLLDRSRVGLVKYGKPLEGTSLSHRQVLQHALEEALDMANYLQAAIRKLDAGEVL